MTPTLQIGDYLIVDKSRHARQVSRGQVYIFESLEEPGLKVIKRAVAVGGDTVEIQAGQLVRNGQVVSEPYLASGGRLRSEEELARTKMREWQLRYLVGVADSAYMPDLNELGPVVVPTGYFFALGDNRQASYDSRYYGFVPDSLVLGVPSFIYFSRDTLGTIWWRRFGVEPR
jgi:signal peptidase I